jgi:predicted dehydrogenase
VWTVNLQRTAASLAEKQQAKPQLFARYADLLAMNDLDAVIIATPDFAHTPILLDATRLRKDAFVEKPMATVLDHANEAVRLVGENKTIVQVGNQRRSDPRHRAGATLIQSGILGKVSEVEAACRSASSTGRVVLSTRRAGLRVGREAAGGNAERPARAERWPRAELAEVSAQPRDAQRERRGWVCAHGCEYNVLRSIEVGAAAGGGSGHEDDPCRMRERP